MKSAVALRGVCLSILLGFTALSQTRTAQLSGHIYSADAGRGLEDAIVTAQSTESPFAPLLMKTASYGSYAFRDIPSGSYFIGAHREGFVGEFYSSQITIASGQSRTGIDVRLEPAPRITTVSIAAPRAAYPQARVDFGMGRFSPDGSLLALAIFGVRTGDIEQVWIYDLRSQRATPVTESPLAGTQPHIRSMVWGDDGTLYVMSERGYPVVHPYNVAATPTKTQEVDKFPPKVVAAISSENVPGKSSSVERARENDRFIVSAENSGHGAIHLRVEPKSGQPFEIARGSWELGSFILDSARVIYPTPGLPGSIEAFDLITRQSRKLMTLPNSTNIRLLDIAPDHQQFLYTVFGPCESDGSESNGALLRMKVQLPNSPPPEVCIARMP